jgi:nucleoside-diphosphate-sugar epimerase
MRALVLGGNRYIGLSLVRALARSGHEVTVANSHAVALPDGVRRIHVDRRRPGDLVAALAPHVREFDIVFDNTAYEVADLEPMVDLFAGHLRQFVFTSSVAVYRRSFVQPVLETFRVHESVADQPLRAYGIGKVRCERFLTECFQRDGFPATSVRVTHTIGPRSPLASRDPAFFARLELGRPILVPGDGFPFVHMIHIDDVASLMVSLIGNDRCVGEVFNAAGAEFSSILACVHLMGRAVGVTPNVVHVPLEVVAELDQPVVHWNEGTAGGTVFSIAKALDHLDWAPRFGLQAAYEDSYRWFASVGRGQYEFDFSADDKVLTRLGYRTPPS